MLGSSSASSFGRLMSARPMASICCSPPESVPATCARRSASRGKSSSTRARSDGTPESDARVGAHREVLLDGEAREHAAPLGNQDQARARALGMPESGETSRIAEADRSGAAGTRPAIARSVEDFPAPLAPIRQTSSPSATSRSMPFTARMPP